ncbi:Hypothetical protein ORPV_390 [Orpheovirus IHUMI-LCC2]|uniref:Uncharacterized protein n=1 Tax=Orpheovirus IHUMI-LCC2 TaxID=2023057 RepID=A0A2I2L436_9VIRU|nr:Hypothetical protein ORPV_390 [Orpheovirus IHUMI-LCC2]SNW62294.1 Hypothetical protein ORPV_390 [Orpheovirus IHUMI-LCC2]
MGQKTSIISDLHLNMDCIDYIIYNCLDKEERGIFRLVNRYFRDSIRGKIQIRPLMINGNFNTVKYLVSSYHTNNHKYLFIKNMICNVHTSYDKNELVEWIRGYKNHKEIKEDKGIKIGTDILFGLILGSIAKDFIK